MSQQVLNASILEGNYVIEGLIQLKDGMIEDNPFSKSVGNCLAADWLLHNESLAKQKIKETMKEQRLGVHEVDECFDYAVYFFLEKDNRDFNPDYFGDEGSETYSIKIYCLHQLRNIVYQYRNEMKKRLNSTVYLVDVDKDEQEPMPKKCISFDILSKSQFEDDKDNFGYNNIVEFQDLQEILDIELPLYNEDFETLGMYNFDLRSYIYHMFLSDNELSLDGSSLNEDTLQLVSSELNITPSALKKINKFVKDSIKNRKDLFSDLPLLVAQLVEGKKQGWKPIF